MRIANLDEVIRDRVVVTRQQVTLAKGFIQHLSVAQSHETLCLIDEYAKQRGFAKPAPIQVDGTPESLEMSIRNVAGYIVSALALGEAIWSLIGSGYLIPGERPTKWHLTVEYRSSRGSDACRLDEFDTVLPYTVRIAPSYWSEPVQPLTDPDLLLAEAALSAAHEEVREALADAVACFRAELYRPAVTMLGKAAEGAWVELGLSLTAAATASGQDCTKIANKMRAGDLHFAKVVAETMKLCQRQDLVGQAFKDAGVSLPEVEEIANWTHVVRDARNAIHFGARPIVGNSYEKVAALLLGAALNLRKMYRLKQAADKSVHR